MLACLLAWVRRTTRWVGVGCLRRRTSCRWSKEAQKAITAKIKALVEEATKDEETVIRDEHAELMAERDALTYGRIYVERSSASFEFRKAWFGATQGCFNFTSTLECFF